MTFAQVMMFLFGMDKAKHELEGKKMNLGAHVMHACIVWLISESLQ